MVSDVKKSGKKPLADRFVDFLFSNDERKWLILIVILGFILRFIVASHLTPVEDESGSISHAIGVSKLMPLSQMAQAQVWYYLTDYSFRIFGVSLLMGRILSVIFGSLSIILVYLIASLILNKKAGLISAFLLAISAYHITWTASYQDQTMMFFVLTASYFFIKTYKESGKISLWAALFLAIAELVKIITGVFVIVFGIFIMGILIKDFRKNKKLFKENFKKAIIFVLILVVAMTPIVAYDYFLYKEKGIVDLAFAQFLRINPEFYIGPGLHHEEGFVLNKLPRNLYIVLTLYFLKEDLIISVLGFIGILYFLYKIKDKDKRFYSMFFVFMFCFVLLFIASSIVLQTHYTSFFPMFSIFGGVTLGSIIKSEKFGKNSTWIVLIFLAIIIIFNLWHIREPLTSQSSYEKAREFSEKNFDQNTLVLVDSRIYTGTYTWIFSGKNYVDASYLGKIIEISNESSQNVPVRTVFVECVNDDCGWGTIKDNPSLNASMEEITRYFESVSTKTTDIIGGGSITRVRGAEKKGVPFFRIYEVKLPLNPQVLQAVEATHNHFLYHVPRNIHPEQAFDYYHVNGLFDNAINVIAYLILYVAIIMAFLSIFVPFYLLIKQN